MFTERKKEKREVQKKGKRFQCLKGSFKNEKKGVANKYDVCENIVICLMKKGSVSVEIAQKLDFARHLTSFMLVLKKGV